MTRWNVCWFFHRPTSRGIGGAFVITILALVGCSGSQESLEDGAREAIIISPSDVHVIGTSEFIAEVKDLEVLQDGSVWVLNSLEPFFLGFSPDGGAPSVFGMVGGGPEEFGIPSAFVTRSIRRESWVLDLGRHALIRISEPDPPRAELPLPRDSLPPGSVITGLSLMDNVVRTARMGGEVMIPRTTRPEGSDFLGFRMAMLGADILAVDTATSSVRKVLSLAEVIGDLTLGFEQTEDGFPLWFRLWAVCGEDQLRVYDRARNELRLFNPQGVELASTPLPPAPFSSVTPRQFAQTIFPLRQAEMAGNVWDRMTAADSARLLNEIARGVRGTPEQLAQYLPRYVDFRCSDNGTMWLRPFDVDTGSLDGGPGWVRITDSGVGEEVRFPDGFDPYRFTTGRAWGVQRDGFDVASIAWVELPRGRLGMIAERGGETQSEFQKERTCGERRQGWDEVRSGLERS